MIPDIVNALFEFGGAVVLWRNVYQLHIDKEVKGVHWLPVAFWSAWGVWNVWYYPHLDQMFSFYAGIFVVLTNLVYLTQMFYYIHRKHIFLTEDIYNPVQFRDNYFEHPVIREVHSQALDMTDIRNIPHNTKSWLP